MDYKKEYEKWLNDPALCVEGKAELAKIAGDEKEVEYRFGGELEFGTAGMRGIIGYGVNMMNIYTVMRATKGLAEWVKALAKTRWSEASSFLTIRVENRKNLQKFPRAFWRRTG